IEVYDALSEETLFQDFAYQAGGDMLEAVIPLADLGLTPGQTIAISAFQEGASDGWATDWMESAELELTPLSSGRMKIDGDFADWAEAAAEGLVRAVDDPADMADSSGDLARVEATVEGNSLFLRLSVHGVILPSVEDTPPGMVNRYYYHWLIDTDNNPATGRSNSEYEGNPTGVVRPIGADRVVQIGWRDGAPNGIEVYDALTEETLMVDFDYAASGDSVEARVPFDVLGVAPGQTVAIAGFQEGASDGWATDWTEPIELTLAQGGGELPLESLFVGNPFDFTIDVYDGPNGERVDDGTASAQVDGVPVAVTTSRLTDPDRTRVWGRHPALLEAGTVHKVTLSCEIGGAPQSQTYTFKVDPYTVLPTEGRFASVNESNRGFVANICQISVLQTLSGPVHSNIAELAELQLAGQLSNEEFNLPYYNEVEDTVDRWVLDPVVVPGVINWYELAPESETLLNFPGDEPFPKLDRLRAFGLEVQGVVIEVLTYLKLEQGYHKLGLYTEGGHKVTAGFDPDGPVLSRFDNGDGVKRVPTYYARNAFFDVVAPVDGYYPIRWLWFQTENREEKGMLLELFSVRERTLHLLNDDSDPLATMAYRAGVLVDPNFVMPTVSLTRQGANLQVTWTGVLQTAPSVDGPWTDFGDDSQSPATFPIEQAVRFFRSRSR
ncbi:MAG: hypothetical protein D6766_04840, partial [Verrucomicrobia bacterium]